MAGRASLVFHQVRTTVVETERLCGPRVNDAPGAPSVEIAALGRAVHQRVTARRDVAVIHPVSCRRLGLGDGGGLRAPAPGRLSV